MLHKNKYTKLVIIIDYIFQIINTNNSKVFEFQLIELQLMVLFITHLNLNSSLISFRIKVRQTCLKVLHGL